MPRPRDLMEIPKQTYDFLTRLSGGLDSGVRFLSHLIIHYFRPQEILIYGSADWIHFGFCWCVVAISSSARTYYMPHICNVLHLFWRQIDNLHLKAQLNAKWRSCLFNTYSLQPLEYTTIELHPQPLKCTCSCSSTSLYVYVHVCFSSNSPNRMMVHCYI